jgi:hypothetical protein
MYLWGLLVYRKLFLLSSVIFVLLSFSLVVCAQSSSTWSQSYGGSSSEWGFSVIATSDDGYAMAGMTGSYGAGSCDFWLVKTDEFGDMEWSQTYGGAEADWATSVIETSDDGYALTGWTESFGDENGDFWLVKTDSSGNMKWNQAYGGPDADWAYAVIETSDEGYAIVGGTGTSASGLWDIWLVKTDSAGNMQWNQSYGGDGEERARSLIQTSDGGYVISGYTTSFADGGADFWLIKTDASGNVDWNRTYGRTSDVLAVFYIPPFSLVKTPDGGYAMAGPTGASYSVADVCLIKTDEDGEMEWIQTYGGPDTDWATSLATTPDGGYAIAGNTDSSGAGSYDFWLIKTDASGNMQWKKTYGGTDDEHAFSSVATSDGKYVIAGYTMSFAVGAQDFWLVKTDGCPYTYDLNTYEFDFSYGYGLYTVVVSTNSTLGGFDFGINQNQIRFTVTGPTGTTGFCRIVIPEIVGGTIPVYLNETALDEGIDYTRTYNSTHTTFEITYSHSTHLIEITGTNVVPEYTSWIIPTLLMATTMFFVIYKKRLFNQC